MTQDDSEQADRRLDDGRQGEARSHHVDADVAGRPFDGGTTRERDETTLGSGVAENDHVDGFPAVRRLAASPATNAS